MTDAVPMDTPPDRKPLLARGIFWPLLICALLLMQIGLSVAAYIVANRDKTSSVETNYYKKAVEWDTSAAAEHAAASLGWETRFSVSADKAGFRVVQVNLHDKAGAPIEGAAVTMIVFHHAAPGDSRETPLHASAPGVYAVALPLARAGVWEFRYKIELGGVVATHHQQIDLQPGQPGGDQP